MEATKNITAKEREFIAAVEAHRNAEGKVIAWDICANGNGKVIFENATKDRYSCAHVIDMEGGYFLLFVGERAGHPYDRKTYKRKGNALKGFKMQEGHNEPPTFAATPTETPQISTETAEAVNVSAEGENAENEPQKHISEVLKEAERNYQCVKSETLRTVREADGKWHTYFMDEEIGIDLAYDQINHIPAARAAQAAEEVAEIRRYMNRLNGNHIADADYYLAEMREGIKQAEAARRKKNADTEGENKAERAKYRVSRFGGYKIIVGDREQGKVIAVLMAVNGHNVIEINDESAHIATMGEKPLQMDKPITQLSDAEVLGLIYGYIELPQSPETPQTVECTADTPKPRETARKRQNRVTGSTQHHQHSVLGANGYAMLNDASATMAAMNVRQDTLRNTLRPVAYVPRECSTVDAAYW